jgi:hypothetical protein
VLVGVIILQLLVLLLLLLLLHAAVAELLLLLQLHTVQQSKAALLQHCFMLADISAMPFQRRHLAGNDVVE